MNSDKADEQDSIRKKKRRKSNKQKKKATKSYETDTV